MASPLPAATGVLRVGTRGSRLAVWQADHVAERLLAAHPGLRVERVVIETLGDRVDEVALSRIGRKGLFTAELEKALRDDSVDMAAHSLKDLPTSDPDGLTLAAVLEREDPRDALLCPAGQGLADLPAGSRLGTSSLRRRAQVLALRPDLIVVDLRGNVPTRVAKLERGECDATVLAHAGLIRLGLQSRIRELLDTSVMLPAPGQGAIAVQCRTGDVRVRGWLAAIDHAPTRLATAAERALLGRLEGGCQTPVAALATLSGTRLELRGLVADLEGRHVVRGDDAAAVTDEADARRLGARLAERLIESGAGRILEQVRGALRAGASEP